MSHQIETAAQDLDLDTLDHVVGGIADAKITCRKAGGHQEITTSGDPSDIIAI